MNPSLIEAARSGDIKSLYSIIENDPYILDRIDQVPFVDTPLHISAESGKTHFSVEIMRLKPSFGKKLNPQGYTLMHLAVQNNQKDTVYRLLDIDPELASIEGREGLTPLHNAASAGKVEILNKLLKIGGPKLFKKLTIRKQSALHFAIITGDVESLKILLEWTAKACIECFNGTCLETALNWGDDEGNTILHIAASNNKLEMLQLLVNKCDVTANNMDGLTAFDIIKNRDCFEVKKNRDTGFRYMILKGVDLSSFS